MEWRETIAKITISPIGHDPSVGNGAVEFVVFGFAIGPAEQGAKYAESR